jgi:hypothetical protein
MIPMNFVFQEVTFYCRETEKSKQLNENIKRIFNKVFQSDWKDTLNCVTVMAFEIATQI